jgi:hypothetical protein
MRITFRKRSGFRFLRAGFLGAGLLSITNPTRVDAIDLGFIDVTQPGGAFTDMPNPFPRSPMGVNIAAGDLDGDGVDDILVGPGRGGSQVALMGGDHSSYRLDDFITKRRDPHAGVSVATGDVDGDGRAEVILTPSTGRNSAGEFVNLPLGQKTLALYSEFDSIYKGFAGGVSVASGDLDGDGDPDFVAGRKVNKIDSFTIKQTVATYDGFVKLPPLPAGIGGVQVAVGDVDGDGFDDVFALPNDPAPGSKASPLLYKGAAASATKDHKWIEIESWSLGFGVHVAMDDFDGDGQDDLVVGSPAGTDPFIKIIKFEPTAGGGVGMSKGLYEWIKNSFDKNYRTGIHVATGDVNGDGVAEVLFGPASVPEPATVGLLAGALAWVAGAFRRRGGGAPPG